MNILYTIAFPGGTWEGGTWEGGTLEGVVDEEPPRALYRQLRAATAAGQRIPIDCPYEIGLVRPRAGAERSPVLAVLLLGTSSTSIGDLNQPWRKVEDWFRQCGGEAGWGQVQPRIATHLKLETEFGTDFEVIDTFGTFVGEPEPSLVGTAAEKGKPANVAAEGTAAILTPPVIQGKDPVTAPPKEVTGQKPVLTPREQAALAEVKFPVTCRTYFMYGAVVVGLLMVAGSCLLGGLMALGAFADGSQNTSMAEFAMVMACFPLPIFVFGMAFLVGGIIAVLRNR